jgi:hypothetical protein
LKGKAKQSKGIKSNSNLEESYASFHAKIVSVSAVKESKVSSQSLEASRQIN